MLKTYFRIAFRNLVKNKTASFINIVGLSVGLACCMLIVLYLLHELNYDRHQQNRDNLYQLGTIVINEGKETRMPTTPAPMGEVMKQDFPEIQESTRLVGLFVEDKTLLQYAETPAAPVNSFYETKGYLADPSFFRLFDYQFTEGNKATALQRPNTMVLSEEIARRIFGNQPALNKVIHISSSTDGDRDVAVSGVFRPDGRPSHIDARFFLSMSGGGMESYVKSQGATDMVRNNMFFTYFLLKPGSDPAKLESKFPAFVAKHMGEALKKAGRYKKQFLISVTDIHLHSGMDRDVTPGASVSYLYILGSIALLTLLIACINFMNLSTARSSKRSAEVGIRKTLGAERKALIWQFLGESFLLSLFAFVLALVITTLLLPAFNNVSGRALSFSNHTGIIGIFLALALLTGLLAGSYPAFYLSSFKPVKVLKGRFSNSLAAVSLRKGLVVFQFFISAVLIIASIVIARQMQYLRSKDLGFAKDRQLVIPLHSQKARDIYGAMKNELARTPQVLSTGGSKYYPGTINPSDNGFYRAGQTMNEAKRTRTNRVDTSFLQTLGIQPVAGRLFSAQFPGDTSFTVILNETAVKDIGFASPQAAIGQKVFFDLRGTNYGYTIAGVVKDFHFEDLHQPITPYAFQLNKNSQFNYLVVHAAAGDMKQLLATVDDLWHRLNPGEPFEYSFLDSDFQKNYEAETRLSAIVVYFTAIAILISCLGLFGLAAFSAEQRIKEIGVRKVLGASVGGIVTLLSKDFIKLVLLSIVIASPVAWYVMHRWLNDFAYRVTIQWWVFLAAGIAACLIALITTGFQAVRAAMANPVKSLRSE